MRQAASHNGSPLCCPASPFGHSPLLPPTPSCYAACRQYMALFAGETPASCDPYSSSSLEPNLSALKLQVQEGLRDESSLDAFRLLLLLIMLSDDRVTKQPVLNAAHIRPIEELSGATGRRASESDQILATVPALVRILNSMAQSMEGGCSAACPGRGGSCSVTRLPSHQTLPPLPLPPSAPAPRDVQAAEVQRSRVPQLAAQAGLTAVGRSRRRRFLRRRAIAQHPAHCGQPQDAQDTRGEMREG